MPSKEKGKGSPSLSPSGNFRPPLESLIHTKLKPRMTAAERERIAHPFTLPSKKPNLFGRHIPLNPPAPFQPKEETAAGPEPEIDLGLIVDAETGERLMPTKSVWSTTEGRLNMDRHTIIIRGTGALDVSANDPLRRKGGEALRRVGAAVSMGSHILPPAHAHKKPAMHSLVAQFMRNGPLLPMHHKYWDPEAGEVKLPSGFVNDADGDAPGDAYDMDVEYIQGELQAGLDAAASDDSLSLGASTLVSSIGPSSGSSSKRTTGSKRETPDERKARWRREKNERMVGKKAGLANLIEESKPKPLEEPPPKPPTPEQKEIVVSDASTLASQVGEKLDPKNTNIWKALEARYYKEICDYALEYEYNKLWTKEKRLPNGVRGMQEACRQYALWRTIALKNIVSSIDEEQRRDLQRIEIEDQIVDEAKLKALVIKHDEERHKHRTFVRMSMYEMEIVMVDRLYRMGILW